MTKKSNEKIFKIMNALFIAGIVVASIFVGYIHYPASKGTITDKSFVAAEYEIKEETNFLFVGKVPISRNKDYIYEYPDRYILTITEERLFNRKIKSNIYVTKACLKFPANLSISKKLLLRNKVRNNFLTYFIRT